MHDLGNIITAFGTMIGTIVLLLKAFNNGTKSGFDDTTKQLEKIINQKSDDIEFYRQKWLKVEKENERLKRKIDKEDNRK